MACLAKTAKLKEVTVLVKELDDTELAIETLIANEFRKDLDPWERAEYLLLIKEKAGIKTNVELGKLVGMTEDAIKQAFRYLKVDEQVREKSVHEHLPHTMARDIGDIPDKETQRKVADKVDEEVKERILHGELSQRSARIISDIPDMETQRKGGRYGG